MLKPERIRITDRLLLLPEAPGSSVSGHELILQRRSDRRESVLVPASLVVIHTAQCAGLGKLNLILGWEQLFDTMYDLFRIACAWTTRNGVFGRGRCGVLGVTGCDWTTPSDGCGMRLAAPTVDSRQSRTLGAAQRKITGRCL